MSLFLRPCTLMASLLVAAVFGVPFSCAYGQAPSLPVMRKMYVVGCAECTGPQSFSVIRSIGLDAQHRVLVADADEPKVRIFEADGTVRTAFGRSGRGPGELMSPLHVSARSDGRIQVLDGSTQLLSIFEADGEFMESLLVRGFPTGAGFNPAAGVLYLLTTSMVSSRVQRWDMRDSSLTTVFPALGDFPPTEPGHPLFVHPAVAPDGSFALGDGATEYRIRVFAADGSPSRDITRTLEPERKSEREIEEERRMAERRRGRMGADVRLVGPQPDPDPFRPFFHRRDALTYDDAGRLWVRTTRGRDGMTVFDLFDRTGTFLGEVRIDAAIGMFTVRAGFLAGVTVGELDIPTVTVWRFGQP